MNKKFLLVALVLLLALSLSSSVALAQKSKDGEVYIETYIYEYDENLPRGGQEYLPLSAPWTDLAVHGTLWTPERRWRFKTFKPMGWGTVTKAKVVTQEWVHISVPYITYIEDIAQKIRYVEFCAKSSNGAVTKPIRMDLWAHNQRFLSRNIAWPANNNINCFGASFSPGIWKQDLGISVLIKYANVNHKVTLYKAWVQTERP